LSRNEAIDEIAAPVKKVPHFNRHADARLKIVGRFDTIGRSRQPDDGASTMFHRTMPA
jgi:hypothetical protein